MIQEKIVEGGLLYHAVHGLCRVEQIMEQPLSGEDGLCYSLVPKITDKTKTRFIITAAGMEASGFHGLLSLKEANEILEYLKEGDRETLPSGIPPKAVSSPAEQNQAWGLAQVILSFSCDKSDGKYPRNRPMLERSAKGLVGELAFVFKTTLKETAARLQKSLESRPKINPSVLAALAHAGED